MGAQSSSRRRVPDVAHVEPAPDAAPLAMRGSRLMPLALCLLAFTIYVANLRPMGAADTIPARLLPFSILREGNMDLDEFDWLRAKTPAPYFIRQDGTGHWRSKYPVVTPLLVAPLAAPFVWWSQAWQIADNDARFRLLVTIFDRVAAAAVTALSVALVFLAARCIAPMPAATAAALVYAFGTTTWSISSQSLWQHAVAESALAGASLCLLRGEETRRSAFLTGVLIGLAISARPQSAVVAPVFALFFWFERRRDFAAFVVAPVVMAVGQVAYNLLVLQRVTGGYATGGIAVPTPTRALGLLISPSRGLFVYCPLALLAFAALRRSTAAHARLLQYFAVAIVVYVLFFACFRTWWAGYSYGPRFFTDVMPLTVLCALPAARRLWPQPVGRALVIAGVVWGVAVQIIGVYFDANLWNRWPASIDTTPARLWDWSDSQILREARGGWRGGDLGPLLRQLMRDTTPAPLVPLEWENLQGAVEPLGTQPWRMRSGGGRMEVLVTNRGHAVWPAFSDFGDLRVGLAAVWKANGVVLEDVGNFEPLSENLAPGASTKMRVWIKAPLRHGQYNLDLNLVQSLGSSGRFGGVTATLPVVVE